MAAERLKPSHEQIAEYLIDAIINDMTQFLMEDYGYTLEQALETIYASKMFPILTDPESELYIQSSSYNYETLVKERCLN